MSLISDEGHQHPRAKFPPVINSIDFLGEVKEDDFLRYSRNIGCSSILGGSLLFLFGDTFAFQPPPHSQFIGVASSTASLGSVLDPLFTHYPSCSAGTEEKVGSNIVQFIPFTKDEDQHNLSRGGDMGKAYDRFYLWTFNSVIEIPGQHGIGVVWFIKGKTNDHRQENDSYYGVGVAEVEMKRVDVTGVGLWEEIPVAKRRGDIIFDNSSPQWGNVATLLVGDFIYLYGTYHQHHRHRRRNLRRKAGDSVLGLAENPVFVCRVPYANKSYLFPERYTYWNGETFVAAPTSMRPSRYKGPHNTNTFNLEPVMYSIQSGTIFYTKLFSSTEEGLFVVIGCDGSGDGKVRLKIAENPWGPWRGEGWILDLETEDRGNKGVKSCVYAHIWASDLERGEMMLTWSEPWPGGVEMVKIGFEMADGIDEQSIESDNDSIYSGVREQLFPNIGRKQSQEVEIINEDDSELTEDEKERREARRHAYAKLSGEVTVEDNLSCFMLNYNEYQDQIYAPKTQSGLFSRNPFSEDQPNGNLFGEQVNSNPSSRPDINSDETAADQGLEENEGVETGKGVERGEGGRGIRRLTGLFQGSWYVGAATPKHLSVRAERTDDGNEDDEEEEPRAISPECQTYDSADTETNFSTAGTLVRRSFFYPQHMHPATIEDVKESEEWSGVPRNLVPTVEDQRNKNRTAFSPGTEASKQPLPIPLHSPDYAQRNRVNSNAFSLISLDDPMAEPIGLTDFHDCENSSASSLTSIDDPRADSTGVFTNPPKSPDHHQPGYWRPRNGGAGPPVTEPDEDMGMRILVPGGRSGYEGGGYVTTVTRELHWSAETWDKSWHESKEKIESSSPKKSKIQWPIGKVLKGGVQRLLGRKEIKNEEDKLQHKERKGLTKKFSEMNLKVGRSMVSLKKAGKSEVHLQNFEEDPLNRV